MSDSNRRLVAGSYSEMKTQMMLLKQQKIESEGFGSFQEKELAPKRRGKILIKLCFSGKTAKGKRKTAESSFRLMSQNPATITLDQVKLLSQKIVAKFGNWQHQTGKLSYCYADWDKGYQLQQIYVPSEAEAKRVVEQILDIQGHSPEWEYLTLNKNVNEEVRYPELPDKITIAGKSVRPPQQRASAIVKFQRALIKFPHLPSAFPLCNKDINLINDLNFLNDYDD